MSVYKNQVHRHRTTDHSDSDNHTQSGTSTIEMETISDSSTEAKANIFIVFVFILELLLLVFLVLLEYYLRFTQSFPVYHNLFECNDSRYGFSTNSTAFDEFDFSAHIPFEVVISIVFCLPPVIILFGEIGLRIFSHSHQKTVRALCRQCKVPQLCRRMIRYIGAYLFGLLMTMIFTDVMKLMTGRLRPNFLELCQPNTSCVAGLNDEDVCKETDKIKLRNGRLSFPSIHASMTAYAAGFIAVYFHNIVRTHSIRLLRPFLSLGFVLTAVMCCLQRYGHHYSHVEDVAVGFALGMIIALYMAVFVLNNFREQLSGQSLYNKLKYFLADYKARELGRIKDEHYEFYNSFGNPYYFPPSSDNFAFGAMHIPRPQTRSPHMNESSIQPERSVTIDHRVPDHHTVDLERRNSLETERTRKIRQQNTFQRDLARTLDQYRRDSSDGYGQSHM